MRTIRQRLRDQLDGMNLPLQLYDRLPTVLVLCLIIMVTYLMMHEIPRLRSG